MKQCKVVRPLAYVLLVCSHIASSSADRDANVVDLEPFVKVSRTLLVFMRKTRQKYTFVRAPLSCRGTQCVRTRRLVRATIATS